MIYCGKAEFGHIFRSFASNSGAILLKGTEYMTQIGFPSLRPVKSGRLPGSFAQINIMSDVSELKLGSLF